ncbi:MAG: DUF2723 domain-containing protein [Candidatus Firestonebacteria bacterium]
MRKSHLLLGILALTISLFIYLLTICPTVYVGDSGEMITAVYHLGIAHPPGYPLFCMIGKLFTYLPLGTIAFRVNLVAAFFGSLTVLILFLTLFTVRMVNTAFSTPSQINWDATFIAFSASLLFAFSKTFWSQSLIAKGGLYTLNAFFIILIINLLYSLNSKFTKNKIIIISVICGFSLANHNTIAPLIILFFIFILWQAYLSNKKKIFTVFFTFLTLVTFVAFFTYLYLPIRSATNPPIDWGHPANFWNFLNHIFRKQYLTISSSTRSIELFIKQTSNYFSLLISQFTPFLIWISLPGIYLSYKWNKKIFLLFTLIFVCTSFGLILMTNPPVTVYDTYVYEVFFIPSYLIVSIWIFFGFYYLTMLFKKRTLATLFTFFTSFTFLFPLTSNYFENDRSRNFIACDYCLNILKTPEINSILFLSADNDIFPSAYLHMVEKIRTDLEIYDDFGRVFKNIYGEDFLRMGADVYHTRVTKVQREIINSLAKPVYFIIGGSIDNMDDITRVQDGILYKTGSKKIKREFNYPMRGIEDNTIYLDYFCREIIAYYHILHSNKYIDEKKFEIAMQVMKKAEEIGKDSTSVKSMLGQISAKFSPELALNVYQNEINKNSKSAEIYNNLGTAYHKIGKFDEAILSYKKALEINPKYFKSYFNIGAAYLAKGDYKNADESFVQSLNLNPTYTDAYYALGNSNFLRQNYNEALKYYTKTIEINPSYCIGWNAIGASLHGMGNFDKAVEFYLKALEINPDYLEARGNLINAYIQKGDIKSAEKYKK